LQDKSIILATAQPRAPRAMAVLAPQHFQRRTRVQRPHQLNWTTRQIAVLSRLSKWRLRFLPLRSCETPRC